MSDRNKNDDNIGQTFGSVYSLRVNQIDAQSLDDELHSIIGTKLNNIPLEKFKQLVPELEALAKLYIWWNTIRTNGISIGQSILGLRYYDISNANDIKKQLQRRQTLGIAFMQIIIPWIKHRIHSAVKIEGIKNAVELVDTFYNTINFINSLIFLYYGRHRSVWERFLKLGTGLQSSERNETNDGLHYELMNRELLWHAFAEFLTFILPLINFYRLRNTFLNLLRTYILRSKTSEVSNINERQINDLKYCPVCNEWPINAHQFGCKHVFCYYCLMSNYLSDQMNGFSCPLCLYKIDSIHSITKVKALAF